MAGGDALKQAVLVGAGRMGGAMMRGWLRDLNAAGLSAITVVEPQPDADIKRSANANAHRAQFRTRSRADIVVLAVKPQGFGAAATDLKKWVGPQTLVISIMAGVTIERIVKALGSEKVVRAMPNTPGAIGKGVTGCALSCSVRNEEVLATSRLLEGLGAVVGSAGRSEHGCGNRGLGFGACLCLLPGRDAGGRRKIRWARRDGLLPLSRVRRSSAQVRC